MKLKLCELNPNPFKKYINEGELNPDRIEILKESINHGTLPEHFYVRRRKDGKFELTSGHHSVGALRSVKGSSYSVDVTVVDFSDEQMLIDMVRENMTQRDTDYHDTREGIVLARNWLESNTEVVKQFNNFQGKRNDLGEKHIGYRDIADFLSKNGKAVSYVTVKNYLDVHDKLSPELLQLVKKQDHATAASGEKDIESISVRDAIKIASITSDFDEQKDLVEAVKNSCEQHGNQKQINLTTYRNAPDEIKQQVRQGKLDLADIEDAVIISKRDNLQTDEIAYYIPTFDSQIKQFNKDVIKLEQQVALFNKIFIDSQFKEKYHKLKNKDKKLLNEVILNIRNRIKKCYDRVEFFMEQLPNESVLVEEEN